MLPLKNKELKAHEDAKICYICGKYFIKNSLGIYIIEMLEIIAIIKVNKEVHHSTFVIWNLTCLMKPCSF